MLSEFALSPAVFRTTSYESEGMADFCIRTLKQPFLEDCLVRNLHGGDWFKQLNEQRGSLPPMAKELIKKLKTQGRLIGHEPAGIKCPTTDEEWEIEAVLSSEQMSLRGMIFSKEAKNSRHRKNPFVACPETLPSVNFWKERPCSLRIPRGINEYCDLMLPLLRHASWIAFIDPHINPERKGYSDFIQLLTHPLLTERSSKPTIEIHRVAWLEDRKEKQPNKLPKFAEIETIFRDNWSAKLERRGIKVEVFLWVDFHDRFVASNLVSMTWSNGFDTTSESEARVTVGRLSRADQDDLQKEFAANSTRHGTPFRFKIGSLG